MARTYPFKKLDAFATGKSEGNPAGFIRMDEKDSLGEPDMLRIARELKGFVNEVGYLHQVEATTFSLRYFSSEREVDFCGHATIAILYDLLKGDPTLQRLPVVEILTQKGRLLVENQVREQDAVFIMAPVPEFRSRSVSGEAIAKALGLPLTGIGPAFDPAIVNGGLETLLVPISSLQLLLDLSPDFETIRQFCVSQSIDIIEVFCPETVDADCAYRTRVFAPTFGYLEDPATGSGNSALGYFLLSHGQWDGNTLAIEQNGSRDRYNLVKLKTRPDTDGRRRIMFGGGAVTRIAGEYYLP